MLYLSLSAATYADPDETWQKFPDPRDADWEGAGRGGVVAGEAAQVWRG